MKKIAHWLLEKAKKDMRTDPFTTPSRRTKLSYYFDTLVSMIFYLMGIYLMLMDLYQELFTANHTDFLGTALMALVLLLGGLLFRWSAYADFKAINRYQQYLKQPVRSQLSKAGKLYLMITKPSSKKQPPYHSFIRAIRLKQICKHRKKKRHHQCPLPKVP